MFEAFPRAGIAPVHRGACVSGNRHIEIERKTKSASQEGEGNGSTVWKSDPCQDDQQGEQGRVGSEVAAVGVCQSKQATAANQKEEEEFDDGNGSGVPARFGCKGREQPENRPAGEKG